MSKRKAGPASVRQDKKKLKSTSGDHEPDAKELEIKTEAVDMDSQFSNSIRNKLALMDDDDESGEQNISDDDEDDNCSDMLDLVKSVILNEVKSQILQVLKAKNDALSELVNMKKEKKALVEKYLNYKSMSKRLTESKTQLEEEIKELKDKLKNVVENLNTEEESKCDMSSKLNLKDHILQKERNDRVKLETMVKKFAVTFVNKNMGQDKVVETAVELQELLELTISLKTTQSEASIQNDQPQQKPSTHENEYKRKETAKDKRGKEKSKSGTKDLSIPSTQHEVKNILQEGKSKDEVPKSNKKLRIDLEKLPSVQNQEKIRGSPKSKKKNNEVLTNLKTILSPKSTSKGKNDKGLTNMKSIDLTQSDSDDKIKNHLLSASDFETDCPKPSTNKEKSKVKAVASKPTGLSSLLSDTGEKLNDSKDVALKSDDSLKSTKNIETKSSKHKVGGLKSNLILSSQVEKGKKDNTSKSNTTASKETPKLSKSLSLSKPIGGKDESEKHLVEKSKDERTDDSPNPTESPEKSGETFKSKQKPKMFNSSIVLSSKSDDERLQSKSDKSGELEKNKISSKVSNVKSRLNKSLALSKPSDDDKKGADEEKNYSSIGKTERRTVRSVNLNSSLPLKKSSKSTSIDLTETPVLKKSSIAFNKQSTEQNSTPKEKSDENCSSVSGKSDKVEVPKKNAKQLSIKELLRSNSSGKSGETKKTEDNETYPVSLLSEEPKARNNSGGRRGPASSKSKKTSKKKLKRKSKGGSLSLTYEGINSNVEEDSPIDTIASLEEESTDLGNTDDDVDTDDLLALMDKTLKNVSDKNTKEGDAYDDEKLLLSDE